MRYGGGEAAKIQLLMALGCPMYTKTSAVDKAGTCLFARECYCHFRRTRLKGLKARYAKLRSVRVRCQGWKCGFNNPGFALARVAACS